MPVGQNPPAHNKTLKGAKKKREKQLKPVVDPVLKLWPKLEEVIFSKEKSLKVSEVLSSQVFHYTKLFP